MSIDKAISRKNITFFLQASLNCQYYLLVSPFRLKLLHVGIQNGSSKYVCHAEPWLPQKCLCFILTCLCFPWIPYTLSSALPTNPKNPTAYLTMGFYVLIGLYQISFIKKFWLQQASITKLCNFLLDTVNISIPNSFAMRSLARWLMILMCIMYAALSMLHWTLRKSSLTYPLEFPEHCKGLPWNWKWLWFSGVLVGRDMFHVGNSSENDIKVVDWILSKSGCSYPFTVVDAVVGVMASAGQYFRLMLVTQCELLLLVVV